MLNLQLSRSGKIVIDGPEISIVGFEADGAMCREVAILALVWGIGRLQEELRENIRKPGGTGNVSID